jgi:Cu+-exporting ATPase
MTAPIAPEIAPEIAPNIDPVCGMVPKVESPYRLIHEGREILFCGAGCKAKFERDPKHYANGPAQSAMQIGPKPAPQPMAAGTIWTCPMDPEVVLDHPGACPICGMATEPMIPSLDQGANPELVDMTRRLIIALGLTLPVFVLEMGGHVFGWHLLAAGTGAYVQALLASPVVLWAGAPFFQRGFASIRSGNLNMFTLISMGAGTAWAYSMVAACLPQIFPAEFHDAHGAVAIYFEAAAVITTLVLLGQVLELRARAATGGAIQALLALAPKTARRLRELAEEDVEIDAIEIGDHLRVRPGEKVPIDGLVIDGHSTLDESVITGESMPVTKIVGQHVIGGTLNQTGALVIKATAIGKDTMLARIIALVADAQRSRAPIQHLADRVAGWFVPIVIAIAAISFVFWLAIGPAPALTYGLIAAVSVLIIACPCALGLATPMSIMVGMGRGAQAGVLIRNAAALEQLEKVNILVVDKTGTLTMGKPALVGQTINAGFDGNEILRLAASLESRSEHPLALAMVQAARDHSLTLVEPQDFNSPTGKGVTGMVDGHALVVGQARFLAECGIDTANLAQAADVFAQDGITAIFVAIDGQAAGVFGIADPIKSTTPAAIAALKRLGIHIVMITGDNRLTAGAVARQLGIDDLLAEVLPQDKAAAIARFKAQGRIVAMAGDGVNDAPALAVADVGIAMGKGSDVAIESAGVILLGGDLNGIVRAITLSRATMGNIRQNLFFAFAYNAIGIPLAAGMLYPLTHDLLSPMIAAAAMAMSSISVIGNAMRLRLIRL